jgi:hypothetical protein
VTSTPLLSTRKAGLFSKKVYFLTDESIIWPYRGELRIARHPLRPRTFARKRSCTWWESGRRKAALRVFLTPTLSANEHAALGTRGRRSHQHPRALIDSRAGTGACGPRTSDARRRVRFCSSSLKAVSFPCWAALFIIDTSALSYSSFMSCGLASRILSFSAG